MVLAVLALALGLILNSMNLRLLELERLILGRRFRERKDSGKLNN